MISFSTFLTFAHIIGLAVGVGAATVKLVLLFKCKSNYNYIHVFNQVSKPITRLIILGLILLTLSGVGWLFLQYPLTTKLIVKIVLVVIIWILGPIIDNTIEPQLLKSTPASGQPVTPEFLKILNQYLIMEIFATGLFYVIIVLWRLVSF